MAHIDGKLSWPVCTTPITKHSTVDRLMIRLTVLQASLYGLSSHHLFMLHCRSMAASITWSWVVCCVAGFWST